MTNIDQPRGLDKSRRATPPTKTPFAQLAPGYIERGFSILPELPRSKIPGVRGRHLKGWQCFCVEQASPEQIAAWIRDAEPGAGISVCGGFGGLVPVDADHPAAFFAIREVLGGLGAPSKAGERGATAFFYDPTGSIGSRNLLAKKNPETGSRPVLVEILGTGRKSTLPPSIHPKTLRPYIWRRGSLEELRPSDLPVITPQHIADLEAALAPLMEPKRIIPFRPAFASSSRCPENDFEKRRRIASARVAIEREAQALTMARKPGRNRTLFIATSRLGKHVHDGFLDETALTAALSDACARNGLIRDTSLRDVEATIARGLNISRNDPLPELAERRWRA